MYEIIRMVYALYETGFIDALRGTCDTVVAIAAPATPSCGGPKTRKKSRLKFITFAANAARKGVLCWQKINFLFSLL